MIKVDRDDSDTEPPLARENSLRHVLNVHQVQDIVSNARQQVAEPTPEQLLAAFLFYFERDAFIDFSKPSGPAGTLSQPRDR